MPVEDGNFPHLGRNSFIKLNVTLKEGRVYDVWKKARELWQNSTRQRQEMDPLRELFAKEGLSRSLTNASQRDIRQTNVMAV